MTIDWGTARDESVNPNDSGISENASHANALFNRFRAVFQQVTSGAHLYYDSEGDNVQLVAPTVWITSGAVTPEGNVTSVPDRGYLLTTDDSFWIKATGTGTTGWVQVSGAGGGSTTLAALTDTTISTPTDGQVLTYDTGTAKWINASSGFGWQTIQGEVPDGGTANQVLKKYSNADYAYDWDDDDTGSGTVPASGAKGHLLVGDGASGWVSKPFWHPEQHLVAMSSYGGLTTAGGATGQPGFPYSNPVEAYKALQTRTDSDPTPAFSHKWGVLVFMPGTYALQYDATVSNSRAIIPVGANIDFRAFHTSAGYGHDDATQPRVHIQRADISANDGLSLFGYPDNFNSPHNEWHAWITFEGLNFMGLNAANSSYLSGYGTTATHTTSEAPLFHWWNAGANMIYRDCAFNDNNGYWARVDGSIENLWFDNCFSNRTLGALDVRGWSTGGVLLLDKIQIDNFQRFVFLNELSGVLSNLRAVKIQNSSFEGRTGAATGDWEHIVYRTTTTTGHGSSVGRVASVAIRDCVMMQQDSGNIRFEAIYEEVDSGDGSAWPMRVYIDNSPYRDEVYTHGDLYRSNLHALSSVGRGDDFFFDGAAIWETHNGAKYKNGTPYA